MAGRGAKKPFVSRKKRREIEVARAQREQNMSQEIERRSNAEPVIVKEKQPIALPPNATVGEFSKLLNLPVVTVISQLMRDGIMAGINQTIDYDTMAIVSDELGYIPSKEEAKETTQQELPVIESEGKDVRPPIVTIMGHVDHGKTSLLDKIRQTNIAGHEAGGITQHIGAYQAEVEHEGKTRLITFLDTPGHEAFTAMRSHGAQVADIAILVVAADDGVKPQTIEAINHAKTAHAPIIVAITKTDVPGANVDRVKQQLTEHSLIPEEWGGETIFVPISSVTGEGIKELLEYIVLTAGLKNYRADTQALPQGVVIESHQKPGLGAIATVLVKNGTLRLGDVIVIGRTYGKIRTMTNYLNQHVTQAPPSSPVVIAGLQDTPNFGEPFACVTSEKEARELTEKATITAGSRASISDISQAIAEGRASTLNIVLKADTQGSLEALRYSIAKFEQPGVKPLIIHSGIGDISVSDIQLARAGNAIVFGFNVIISDQIKPVAEREGITVATFKIIYDLLNQIDLTLQGRVKTKKILVEKGRLKVKKVFRSTKNEQIIGGEITQGVALRPASVTLKRTDEEIGTGKVSSLQKGPESVNELEAIQDCGVSIATNAKIQEGDMIIFMVEEEVFETGNEDTNQPL